MILQIENINGRNVCLRGIGELYFQDGMPIEITIDIMGEKFPDVEISWLHIANELLSNNWPKERTWRTIEACIVDTTHEVNASTLRDFIFASYEKQRQMIFKYLFGTNPSKQTLSAFLNKKLKNT